MKEGMKIFASIILGLVLFASISIFSSSSRVEFSTEDPNLVDYSLQTSGIPFIQSETIENGTTYEGRGIIWPAFIFNFFFWLFAAFILVNLLSRILRKWG